jgi:hypothetical protein
MMATKKFMREPKMATTEPSVDEVGHGMKRGGHAKKSKMAMGGAPMMAAVQPRRRMAMAPAMPRGAVMMRKKGGEVESPKQHKAEMKELHKVEKELKHHEGMKASKAHQGLKNGGAPKAGPAVMGGLAGGLEATRPDTKRMTGGVRSPGYKKGGQALAAEMDRFETKTTLKPKLDLADKVHEAKQTKSFSTKTGGVSDTVAGGKAAGYKRGGGLKKYAKGGMALAKHYTTHINDASKPHAVKGKTGQIKQAPAGYKHGGHVESSAKGEHGFTHMKKMCKGGY